MESDPTDMETTENWGEDNLEANIQAQKSVTFEDQLREIDLALNFTPIISEISGVAGNGKSRGQGEWIRLESPIKTTKNPRSPLGDITNSSTTPTQKPKGRTWKKQARAKGQGCTESWLVAVVEKRTWEEAFHVQEVEIRCLKNVRVTEIELLTVEAGVQSCRDQ